MKRILCFALSCMLLLTLVACSNLGKRQLANSSISSDVAAENKETSSDEKSISEPEQLAVKPSQESPSQLTRPAASEENTVSKMNVQVGNSIFIATLADNSAVDSLVEMLKKAPIVIQMSDYSYFEKVGSLGTNLPASDSQTAAQSGDIVLYNGNQIVIFYGSNSWNYTRLGKIDDLTGWKEALGNGDVEVTFRLQNERFEVCYP